MGPREQLEIEVECNIETGKLTEARALPPPHIFRRNLKRYVRADGSELFNFVRRYRTRR